MILALTQGVNLQLKLPVNINIFKNANNTIEISATYRKIGQFEGNCLHQHHKYFQQALFTKTARPP